MQCPYAFSQELLSCSCIGNNLSHLHKWHHVIFNVHQLMFADRITNFLFTWGMVPPCMQSTRVIVYNWAMIWTLATRVNVKWFELSIVKDQKVLMLRSTSGSCDLSRWIALSILFFSLLLLLLLLLYSSRQFSQTGTWHRDSWINSQERPRDPPPPNFSVVYLRIREVRATTDLEREETETKRMCHSGDWRSDSDHAVLTNLGRREEWGRFGSHLKGAVTPWRFSQRMPTYEKFGEYAGTRRIRYG